MFTGLIEDIGTIHRVERGGSGSYRVTVATHLDTSELVLGESIAVDGACFTVVAFASDSFVFEASPESLQRTTLASAGVGQQVHLERAMVLGGRLGGHLVQGHVDGVGTVTRTTRDGNAWRVEIQAPAGLARLVVNKGSITISGVSLTVNAVSGDRFDVAIIPFTGEKTLLTGLVVGDRVNLEADIIGKYVERLLQGSRDAGEGSEGLNMDLLRRHGFA